MGKRVAAIVTILFLIPLAFSDDGAVIPGDKPGVEAWFQANVAPLKSRTGMDPALIAAEANRKVINMKSNGSGDFKTINAAIASIPAGNAGRVVIKLGGGIYNEKIKIERTKPFITLLGDAKDMPTLSFGGTAREYGTVESASLIVESDYFQAVNVIIKNSAPAPAGRRLAQAVALRIGGDKASFYNCKLHGFQDTLCDDKGRHFFKDCFIEGTVDFIFGRGKSIYLNTELFVVPAGENMAMITAQARDHAKEDVGFSFVHCRVTGTGGHAYLGRAWFPFPQVIYAYTEMSDAVHKGGWSNNRDPKNDKTVVFGEYMNTGVGAIKAGRAPFVKQLTEAEVKPYISLAFIAGSSWLLPPTTL